MALSVLSLEILLWVILPASNFLLWYQIGYQQTRPIGLVCPQPTVVSHERDENIRGQLIVQEPQFSFTSVESSRFQRHRGELSLCLSLARLIVLAYSLRDSNCQIELSSQHHSCELLSLLPLCILCQQSRD
jgi:hypothetical protein